MKIVYTENPLRSTVELDASESKAFWLVLKTAQMEDLLFNAYFHMQEDRWYDLDKARRSVDPDYYLSEDDKGLPKLDNRVTDLHQYYIQALLDSHAGDCTCIPCSCDKCHAEGKLGLNTTAGLNKYQGSIVLGLFNKDGVETCAQAIEALLARPEPDKRVLDTIDWLRDYQATKLGTTVIVEMPSTFPSNN